MSVQYCHEFIVILLNIRCLKNRFFLHSECALSYEIILKTTHHKSLADSMYDSILRLSLRQEKT